MPLSVLLGAAALVWLASAWLAGATGPISEAGSPEVVPVVSTVPSVGADGSDDKKLRRWGAEEPGCLAATGRQLVGLDQF